MTAEAIDKRPEFIDKYKELKTKIAEEYATESLRKANLKWDEKSGKIVSEGSDGWGT